MSFRYPKILLLGDSLTQLSWCASGLASKLAESYARKADVLNRGVSGYNSRWLLPLFRQTLKQLTSMDNVLLYVIWVGTNDACLPGSPHHKGPTLTLSDATKVPVKDYQENLRTMICELRAHPVTASTHILVITAPPISVSLLRKKGPREGKDRDYNTAREYAMATLTVVNEFRSDNGIAVINLHQIIEDAAVKDCTATDEGGGRDVQSALDRFFEDGLHLNHVGYDCLYTYIIRTIQCAWPEITPEKTPLTAPWWGELVAQVERKDECET